MQVRSKKKTRRIRNRSTQKILSFITLTKRPTWQTKWARQGTNHKESTSGPTCQSARGRQSWGRLTWYRSKPDRFPSRCTLTWSAPYSFSRLWLRFPYLKMPGTALGGYKRMPSPFPHPHSHTRPFGSTPSLEDVVLNSMAKHCLG
jgi:hypothetical protein